MKHVGTKRLETARLILRQFTAEDADAMYNNWASDSEVTKYLMWPHHETVGISQAVLTDALIALIKFFFEEVGVNRIESRHDPKNPNSGKVMLKCGLKYEGTNREADWNNQGRCDSAMYAILSKDYNTESESI